MPLLVGQQASVATSSRRFGNSSLWRSVHKATSRNMRVVFVVCCVTSTPRSVFRTTSSVTEQHAKFEDTRTAAQKKAMTNIERPQSSTTACRAFSCAQPNLQEVWVSLADILNCDFLSVQSRWRIGCSRACSRTEENASLTPASTSEEYTIFQWQAAYMLWSTSKTQPNSRCTLWCNQTASCNRVPCQLSLANGSRFALERSSLIFARSSTTKNSRSVLVCSRCSETSAAK